MTSVVITATAAAGSASGSFHGSTPVQGYGTVTRADGLTLSWYFRARYSAWTLDVGTPESPGSGYVDDATATWSAGGDWGGDYEAGYMPDDIAQHIVADALARYLRGEENWDAPDDLHMPPGGFRPRA